MCRFWFLYEATLKLAITLVWRLLNRGILYGSWQSYTYCNFDKIVTFFTGRTTDNLFLVFNYFQLWFWPYENSWQSLPTCVVYVRHLYSTQQCMHNALNLQCESQIVFRTLDTVRWSVTLSLYCWVRLLTKEFLDYIMPEVRSSQGVWCTKWLGSQFDRNKFDCMLRIEGLGDNSKIFKDWENRKKIDAQLSQAYKCVACASVDGSHIPSWAVLSQACKHANSLCWSWGGLS